VPTEEEINKIVELHKSGLSQGQIAKEMDKGKGTINRVLKGLGLTNGTLAERSNTKRATDAKADYDLQRQTDLSNKFFERIDELMDSKVPPSDLRSLAVTYGIIVDKRALLDGRPTGNLDVNVTGKSIDERLAELAARRDARKAPADQ
jgi:hypothetical protein